MSDSEAETTYSYFLAALREKAEQEGRGIQASWAIDINKSPTAVNLILSGKSRAGFKVQNLLAQACGYDYIKFLEHGRRLLAGKQKDNEEILQELFEKLKGLDLNSLKEMEVIIGKDKEIIKALAKIASLSELEFNFLMKVLDSFMQYNVLRSQNS